MNIIQTTEDPALFGQYLSGKTWDAWKVFLKVIFALPLTPEEELFYISCTGRKEPVLMPLKQVFCRVGRRGGKSYILHVVACYLALFFDYSLYLSPGEVGHIVVLAKDRRQAQVIFRYIRHTLTTNPMFSRHVVKELAESIHLDSNIVIEVMTADVGSVRGRTIVACLCDEIAFWLSDGVNPATEVLNALVPSMATIPNSMLLAISTPFSELGLFYEMDKKYWAQDDPEVLVWKADTRTMNPTIDQGLIERALKRDPERAKAEWLAEFRSNQECFLHPDRIDACVVEGRYQLPPHWKPTYHAALDAAFKGDTFAISVAHYDPEQGKVVMDVIEGFEGTKENPVQLDVVVDQIAELQTEYGFSAILGDQYSSVPIQQALRKRGVHFQEQPFTAGLKKDIYSNLKALVNEGTIELLDHKKLIRELRTLEIRVTSTGTIQIGHPRLSGYSDDYATVCALVVRECLASFGRRSVFAACDLSQGESRIICGDTDENY